MGFWTPVYAQDQPAMVEIVVSSNMKKAQGQTIKIPIYMESETIFEADFVSFEAKWDTGVLTFTDFITYDSIELAFADYALVEERTKPTRAYFEFRFDEPNTFEPAHEQLLLLEFLVIGDEGAVGSIQLENFTFGDAEVEISTQDGVFHVLPTALYFNDRDYVEITSSEVFTTFQMDLKGELNVFATDDSGWIFDQTGSIIEGRSPDPEQGVTSLYVPLESQEVTIYSLKLGNDKEVHFVRRPKLFVPLLRS